MLNIFDVLSGTVEIKNLKLVSDTYSTWFRGISLSNTHDMTIKLDKVTIDIPDYYAFNIGSDCQRTNIVMNECDISGWCAVQTWSSDSKIEFNNCELIGLNNASYNAVGWNDFGTVVVNEDSENSSFTFNNSIIKAIETTGNIQTAFDIRGTDTSIAMNSSTTELKGKNAYSYVDKGENNIVNSNDSLVPMKLVDLEQITVNTNGVTLNEKTASGTLIISYKGTNYSFDLARCPNDDWKKDGVVVGTDYYCKKDLEKEMLCFDFDVSSFAYPDTKYKLYLTEFIK